MDAIRIETIDAPDEEEAEVVLSGLDAFNFAAADFTAIKPLACFARADDDSIVGGAIARTWGGCCELLQVWVDAPRRSRGIGRRLVRAVEDEAIARGCTLLYLETFSFQAPAFYESLGYELACRFDGFPDGVSKFVMRRDLPA